jgi:hypothetical protein
MADLDRRAAAGRHTRRPGQAAPARPRRPGVRRASAAALVLLVLQYGLGMILNFYVGVPAADAHAGIFTEIATAPLALTAHALLGVTLVGTAIMTVARALARRDRALAALAAAGLAAIVGAFVAGEMFVKNGQDSTSFAMAMLTGAALLCYVVLLVLTGGSRQARQEVRQQETEPLLVSVPAARPEDVEDYPDDWGVEPGWDDDPSWAQRLRQDTETGWPGRQGWTEPPRQAPRPAVRPQYQAPRPHAQHPQAQHPHAHRPQAQHPQAQHPYAQGPPDWWERS